MHKETQHNWQPFYLHWANMALQMAAPEGAAKFADMLQEKMVDGLRRYEAFKRTPRHREHTVMAEMGTTRLLRFQPARANKHPVLFFVPSLINRYNILDIHSDVSCVGYFLDKGYTVYVVDWDAPSQSEYAFSIDDYIQRRLKPMMRMAAQQSPAKVVPIGYCLGGTMLAGCLARWPEMRACTAKAIFLGTPWDFHNGEGVMDWRLHGYHAACKTELLRSPFLSPVMLQMGFALIDPALWAKKYIAFADMDGDSDKLGVFVAVEDWLNDPVALSGSAAYQLMDEFYRKNAPHTGAWQLGYEPVMAQDIAMPSMVVSAQEDRIVPHAASMALAQALPQAMHCTVPTGHIGMMASQSTAQLVWQTMQRFIEE